MSTQFKILVFIFLIHIFALEANHLEMRKHAEQMFLYMDKNEDGYLELDEFFSHKKGLNKDLITYVFESFDKNSDFILELEEVMNRYRLFVDICTHPHLYM